MQKEDISVVTRASYEVYGRKFRSLYYACLWKAKKEMVREWYTFDENGGAIPHQSLMMEGDFGQPCFDLDKWSKMKRERARELLAEAKALSKESA